MDLSADDKIPVYTYLIIESFLLQVFFCRGGGNMWIYSPYITVKGRRIYASAYGLKVFRFWVDKDKIRK